MVNPFHVLQDQKHKKIDVSYGPPTVKLVGFHLNFRLEANLPWGFLTVGAKRRVAQGQLRTSQSHDET
jgi:hypothetical protein